MNTDWDRRFLELASVVGSWSKDPSTKVGAVIVNENKQIVSMGYNGFPRGVKDDYRLKNRETKYDLIVHAEANAILKVAKSTQSTEGATLYQTLSPCKDCSKLIYQSGIKRVVFSNKYKDTEGIEFLTKAGVEISHISIEKKTDAE